MLFVLSPAKALDFETPPIIQGHTLPRFREMTEELIKILQDYSPAQLSALMGISDKLAQLNVARYASWQKKVSAEHAKQAVLAYNGDVYEGLDACTLTADNLVWLQNHLRILSGLYGVLKPLDWIQAHRLEMGTPLKTAKGKTLYDYWGNTITQTLNADLQSTSDTTLVNVASEEYFKSVKPQLLKATRVITPVFEDWKSGRYKIISFYAKRARGLFVRYACQHQISEPEQLKAFDLEDYLFDPTASEENCWRFRRKLEE